MGVCSIRELYDFPIQCVCYWIVLIVMYVSLQEFESVKTKQVELELLEVKLAQKSVAVAQEGEQKG